MDWTVLGQQVWLGLVNGAGYVIFASGLTLAFGILGIINMAHGELSMLGAMVLWTLMSALRVPFFLAGILAIVIVAALGALLNRVVIQPVIRVSRINVLLSTLGVSLMLVNGGLVFWGSVPHPIETPFPYIYDLAGVRISASSIMLFTIGAIAIALLHLWLAKSRLGKSMRATGQNIVGASLSGINIKRVFDITIMLSAGLAALGGVLLSPIFLAFPTMGQPMLLMGFAIVIASGLGNLTGAIVLGLIIGITDALVGQYITTFLREIFIYGIIIGVLLLRPGGLLAKR